MRQVSWIAFLLFTVGLVTYEASIDQSTVASDSSTGVNQTEEGGGGFPGDTTK